MIRQLKLIGASTEELLDVYSKQIRSVLEFAAAVWHSGLTAINTADIERVQKACFSIILGQGYINYENALLVTGFKRLKCRREDICLNFERKSIKNPKYKGWFVEDVKLVDTRRMKKNLIETKARTTRFRKSTIPYLTHLLNLKGYQADPT